MQRMLAATAAEHCVGHSVAGPTMRRACSVAIVGGGVSGLSCAHMLLKLLPHAHATVFDMGRSGPGMVRCRDV